METDFGFLLQIEGIDLLEFALESKEEGRFVRLERRLRIQ